MTNLGLIFFSFCDYLLNLCHQCSKFSVLRSMFRVRLISSSSQVTAVKRDISHHRSTGFWRFMFTQSSSFIFVFGACLPKVGSAFATSHHRHIASSHYHLNVLLAFSILCSAFRVLSTDPPVGGQVSTTDPPAGGELTEGKLAQILRSRFASSHYHLNVLLAFSC